MLRVLALALAGAAEASSVYSADVVVYGSTPAGIIAAVAATRANASSVILVDFSPRIGGMVAGGLGNTDIGNPDAIGGYSEEFFLRAGAYYGNASTPQYRFEPHVAERVFHDMLNESASTGRLQLITSGYVDSASVSSGIITSVTTTSGDSFRAAVFVDASYEGDLMRTAGVPYTYGREGMSTLNESDAGRREPFTPGMDFAPVSPFDDSGALLPLITNATSAPFGSADGTVQAYNFRLCVTANASNLLPWPQPAAYNASTWTLLRRLAAVVAPKLTSFVILEQLPNGKYDCNNGALVSTDFAGGSWEYADSTNYTLRAQLYDAHVEYMQGLLWTLANDPTLPAALRADVAAHGLCKDEFVSNGGWSEQLYVREARRAVGDFIMTQAHINKPTNWSTSNIGLGSYSFDGHYSSRGPCVPAADNRSCIMVTAGEAQERWAAGLPVWTGGEGYPGHQSNIYQIPYGVLTPARASVSNLLLPTTPSASHVAFCSIRMEPQFMILGHAAGDAAAMAARLHVAVQDLPVEQLHQQLVAEGAKTCIQGAPSCP